MYAAFIFIGTLFGMALTATVWLFYVLSLGGDFKANLHEAARQLREQLTGRRRYLPQVSGERRVEVDARVRSLQEEIRGMQRLLDQARGEREAHGEQARDAVNQTQQFQQDILERDARILALEEELGQRGQQLQTLREQMAERSAALARATRQARDLQTEIDVLNAGVDVVNR